MEENTKLSGKGDPAFPGLTFKIVSIIAVLFIAVFSITVWEKNHSASRIENNGEAEKSESQSAGEISLEKEKISAQIGATSIFLEKAVREEERVLGLSYRETLEEDSGLLFIFDQPDYYQIWMKEMRFPIDIIWLDENKKIVDIKEDARPESFPKTFAPKQKSLYILEVNSGFARDHKIKIGDELLFPQN